jgi:hypothetical protein
MTNPPADLLGFRQTMMSICGFGSAADVGIVGDGAHQRTGGYHEGKDVITSIGRYHGPPASHVGSPVEDYSARNARDRRGLTDSASGVDVGDDWPNGGRKAWLRFNNAFVTALHAGDPALAAIRAVNYSPDGTAKKRTDREHGWAVEPSTDTVNIHTHIEWYRDTEGSRQASFDRIAQLARAAISGTPAPAPTPEGVLMALSDDQQADLYRRVTNIDKILWYVLKGGQDAVPEQMMSGFGAGTPVAAPVPMLGWRQLLAAASGGVSDAQVSTLADKLTTALIASRANGLTDADHAGVRADIVAVLSSTRLSTT